MAVAATSTLERICEKGCAECHLVTCCFHPAFALLKRLPVPVPK